MTVANKVQSKVPQLRFPEFSGSWASYKLGALSDIRSASRVHREQWAESGVPFFRTSDVVAAHKGQDNKKVFIPNDLYEALSKKSGTVKANDLLVTGGGSIGVPYLIPSDDPLYFKDADLLWFSNKDTLNGLYLYEYLLSPKFRRHLERISHKGTISHYTIEQAKKTPIILPKVGEQKKITDLLSSVNKKISLIKQKHEQLVQYKKGILQQLFSQQLRFKDDNGQDFPDWTQAHLNEIAMPIKRKAEKAIGNVMTISAGKGFLHQKERFSQVIAGTSLDKYTLIKEGEFSYNRGNSKSYTYGCIYKLSGDEEALVPFVYRSFKLKAGVADFYAHLFEGKYLDRQLRRLISSSARMDGLLNIGEKDFYKVTVPVPCDEEQKKIATFITSLNQKIDLAQQQIEQTQTYKQGLLQQMFV